jgi:hypothetical protein
MENMSTETSTIIISIALILILIGYIFSGIGRFRLALATGYRRKGLAWVPLLDVFLMANLAQKRKRPLGIVYITCMFISLIPILIQNYMTTNLHIPSQEFLLNNITHFTNYTIIGLFVQVFEICNRVLDLIILFYIYRRFKPEKATIFTVFSSLITLFTVVSVWFPEDIGFLLMPVQSAIMLLPPIFLFVISKPFSNNNAIQARKKKKS